jgi:hypothetical protein
MPHGNLIVTLGIVHHHLLTMIMHHVPIPEPKGWYQIVSIGQWAE